MQSSAGRLSRKQQSQSCIRRTFCPHHGAGRLGRRSSWHSSRLSIAATREALLYDFHDQLIPYEQAWSWQKQRVSELCSSGCSDRRDTVFLLQHPPVYTLGAGSSESHVKFDLANPPHPLYRTERGGEVTYHGPGQLVMYPILDLTQHTQDLHWYLRGLEEVIIRALADTSGLEATRIPGLTGVWVNGHKLAAIGVRARKWVTYHGLALNVSTVLEPFGLITPCGIGHRPVGSVRSTLERAARHEQQQPQLQQEHDGEIVQTAAADGMSSRSHSSTGMGLQQSRSFSTSDSGGPPQQQLQSLPQHQSHVQDLYAVSQDPRIVEYRYALLEAFESVFGLRIVCASAKQKQQLITASKAVVSDALRGS